MWTSFRHHRVRHQLKMIKTRTAIWWNVKIFDFNFDFSLSNKIKQKTFFVIWSTFNDISSIEYRLGELSQWLFWQWDETKRMHKQNSSFFFSRIDLRRKNRFETVSQMNKLSFWKCQKRISTFQYVRFFSDSSVKSPTQKEVKITKIFDSISMKFFVVSLASIRSFIRHWRRFNSRKKTFTLYTRCF